MSEISPDPGGEETQSSPPDKDIEELKEQFEQQQSMISQLKNMLQSNEQNLASKEKEFEEYSAKLSSIKSRSKKSKRDVSESKMVSGSVEGGSTSRDDVSAGPSEESSFIEEGERVVEKEGSKREGKKMGKSSDKSRNIFLLRKKLEENRMKFEQRGKEMFENKKSIEEMVETLRTQLEERDQVIQSLQKDLDNKGSQPSLPAQNDAVDTLQHPDNNSGAEQMDQREMYAQIVYKDNKIVELNNRIMELELSVLDLKENLKEKDEVIDARTKAITLMSEDMSRKSKSTLDSLDDTREQMRLMQNNFITLEARMKDEKENLNKRLEEKDRKLKQVEESHKALESVRFDLMTRVAELQEKVVHLQTINTELQKEVSGPSKKRDMKADRQDRVEELLKALDETNKQMIKVKAQHKNKVKSLTKQIESLKRVSESSEEIVRLQQRVAELEEDKATGHHWERQIQELEDKVKQQSEDLDAHVHALSMLESEKLNLIEDIQSDQVQIGRLEDELKMMKNKLLEVENLKVSAELKTVELEELVDILSREKADLILDNKAVSDERTEYKQLVDSLQQEKTELLEEVMALQVQVREGNPGDTDSNRSEFQMVSSSNSDEEKWKRLSASEEALTEEKHVKDSSNVELSVKLLESELDDTRRIVSEQKGIINDLTLKVEAKEEEIEMHQEVISKLEQLGQEVGFEANSEDVNKISEIVKELNEMSGDLEEWKTRCSEVEDRLKTLENEKVDLEKKLDQVTDENSALHAQLNLQKQVSEDLASKLKQENSCNSDRCELIKQLENSVNQIQLKLTLKEEELQEVKSKVEKEVEHVVGFHSDGNSMQIQDLEYQCSLFEKEVAEKGRRILELEKQLQEEIDSAFTLEQQVRNAKESSSYLEGELKNRDNTIEQLEKEYQSLKNTHDTLKKSKESKLMGESSPSHSEKIQELEKLLNEKEELLSQKENELEKSNQKLRSVSEKVKKIAVNLKAKTVVIQNLEEKEKKMMEILQEKDEYILRQTSQNQFLSTEVASLKSLCDEKDNDIGMLSQKYQSDLLILETEVKDITSQNIQLVASNESLQHDIACREEGLALLKSQISQLEEEIDNLRNGLNMRDREIISLKEQCLAISNLEEEKKVILANNMQVEKRNQELIQEIMKKEEELLEISKKLEELAKSVDLKNDQIESHSLQYKELEQLIVSKDMQITALEGRMSTFQNSWGALEAKLQEREAFIESLEQELAKSHSRQQHLEEGLSFIEERRRSLETKFTALGEQLQESDRIKEEAEEHEGLLENRLAALASSEETLRKKLESLNEQNIELTRKSSDLGSENDDLKKRLGNAENNIKIANREIAKLSSFEIGYVQAQQTIEKLEDDLKQHSVEFERSLKSRESDTQRYIENLELDMKNINSQVETLENEKRCLMEHCEKLNDRRISLEEDLETSQENCEAYRMKAQELERRIRETETHLSSVISGKEKKIGELKQKLQTSETNVDSLSPSTPSEGSGNLQNQIIQLNSEVQNLSALLSEKETEIHSYQSRLLQLQFGGVASSGKSSLLVPQDPEDVSQRREVEKSSSEAEEKLRLKDAQLQELCHSLESANRQISNLQHDLSLSWKKVEEMSMEITHLNGIIQNKENLLQSTEISQNKLPQEIENIDIEHQSHLICLQQQNTHLYEELVKEKAKNIVNDIILSATQSVQELRTQYDECIPSLESNVERVVVRDSVKFDERVVEIPQDGSASSEEFVSRMRIHFSDESKSSSNQELVEKLGDLQAELDASKMEKRAAVMRVEQLESEVNRLVGAEKQLLMLQRRLDPAAASDILGKEAFSKESSVESEFLSERVGTEGVGPGAGAGESAGVVALECSGVLHLDEEEEEGWGWGAEDARLEEEHLQQKRQVPPGGQLELQIAELNKKTEELEKERFNICEELKASQVRCGKMLKKLKDLKLQNERLMHENQVLVQKKSNEFSSLDLAIEEELKFRIDSLEKELKESHGERDSLKAEKEGLLKRVEVVSAANERLMEREQGLDPEFWQNKNKELVNQVESLKWRIEELMEEKQEGNQRSKEIFLDWDQVDTPSKDLQEYQEQIAALSADNEELQKILEEQKNLRVAAETALKDLEQLTLNKETSKLQLESDVKQENTVLRQNFELVCRELEEVRSHTGHDSLIAENAALRENYDELCQEVQQLRSNTNNEIIVAEYASMRKDYEALFNEMEQLRSQVDMNNTLQANYESLRVAHEQLIFEMNNIQKEFCNLAEKYEIIEKEKSLLAEESSTKEKTMKENYDVLLNQIQLEKEQLRQKLDEMSQEYDICRSDVQQLRIEVEKNEEIVARITLENGELHTSNTDLKLKYDELRHANISSPEHDKSSTAETYKPIQLFAEANKESEFDKMLKTSDVFQTDSPRTESPLQTEVRNYKQRVEELENEKYQKDSELSLLREMLSAEQEVWTNTEQNLNHKIDMLRSELDTVQELGNKEGELRESLMVKEHELSNIKSQMSYLEETLLKAQYRVEDLEAQLLRKEEEMQDSSLNAENQENMIQQIVALKEEEVAQLCKTLALKEQEQRNLLLAKEKDIDNLKLQISDLEGQVGSLITMKNQDLQNLKIQMVEMETKMHSALEDKEKEIESLQFQLAENKAQIQDVILGIKEKNQQIMELQGMLEAREDEIREAVLQIRDRNLEIQRLKQSGISGNVVQESQALSNNTNQDESSQQNELDMALYMLHQRDVRCEELTLELMQLLEERDTLQLRLSTALKINEELRNKSKCTSSSPEKRRSSKSQLSASLRSSDLEEESTDSKNPIEVEAGKHTTAPASGTVEESHEDLKVLADKLSQLHSVDYRRDVTLQDEREQRHSEQVMLLQPRAPGVLVESSYTLSRDVQSPSTVLLNWIWGRSTPKVMHI